MNFDIYSNQKLEGTFHHGTFPTVEVTAVENGHRVTFVDVYGRHEFDVMNGEKGDPGDDYVMTDQDKREVAEMAADMVEVPECDMSGVVKSVNGATPDASGNVEIEVEGSVSQEQIAQAVVDYLAENPVEGGMTKTEKNLILTLFRNAAYTSADMGKTLTQLETLWSGSGEDSGGDVHSHSYTAASIMYATCTTDGEITYGCSCGFSYTETIPATGHNYVDGVCTVCGAADPNYSPDEPEVPVEPEVTLSRISATYSGGDVAVGTAVNDLTGITVTAHHSNGTSESVTGYTLNGTIGEGSNTITVNYGGKTTTFTVTGVAESGGSEAVNLFSIGETYVLSNNTPFIEWEEYGCSWKSVGNWSQMCTIPGLEPGKTYTIFADGTIDGEPSANTSEFITGRMSYFETAIPSNWYYAKKDIGDFYPSGGHSSWKNSLTFVVPESAVEVALLFVGAANDKMNRIFNIAIYEGEMTERP